MSEATAKTGINLSGLLKPKQVTDTVKGGDSQSNPAAPLDVVEAQKEGTRYFHSTRPGLAGFIGNRRFQFKGNYLETEDSAVAEGLKKMFGKYVSEIDKDQHTAALSPKKEAVATGKLPTVPLKELVKK